MIQRVICIVAAIAFFNLQNSFPYTLTGDNYGAYFEPWIPQPREYNITATPYSASDTGGNTGSPLTIHLTVLYKNKGATSRMIASGSEAESAEGNGISNLIIYPVPVDNELSVRATGKIGKDAVLCILTVQGIVVYEGTYSSSSLINTADLKSGVYILQVVDRNGFKQALRFIKK